MPDIKTPQPIAMKHTVTLTNWRPLTTHPSTDVPKRLVKQARSGARVFSPLHLQFHASTQLAPFKQRGDDNISIVQEPSRAVCPNEPSVSVDVKLY